MALESPNKFRAILFFLFGCVATVTLDQIAHVSSLRWRRAVTNNSRSRRLHQRSRNIAESVLPETRKLSIPTLLFLENETIVVALMSIHCRTMTRSNIQLAHTASTGASSIQDAHKIWYRPLWTSAVDSEGSQLRLPHYFRMSIRLVWKLEPR